MTFLAILVLALALSMDAFAVSLAASASGRITSRRAAFRLSFHFGLFQFLMPVVGWRLGEAVEPVVASFDHWIAVALLAFVAARMIRAGLDPAEAEQANDPSRGVILVILSIATSIDALAVGLSMAMLRVPIWYPSAVIGIITGAMCTFAIVIGARVGAWVGKRAQVVGGIILLAIAARILVSHIG
jgi:putative Mn2+ efflux pump MntP